MKNIKILILLSILYSSPSYSIDVNEAHSLCLAVDTSAWTSTPSCEFFAPVSGLHQGGYQLFATEPNGTKSFIQNFISYDACSLPEVLDITSGSCLAPNPDCTSIGFDPSLFYPDGFCPDLPNSTASSPHTSCAGLESTPSVPPCSLSTCPDGTFINSAFQTCSLPSQCWDGSLVYGSQPCPEPPYICPDGSQAPNQQACSAPDRNNKNCWDGSTVPLTSSCPLKITDVTCSDGSVALDQSQCPSQVTQLVTCSDGSQSQSLSQCPPVTETPTNVGDTSTSTSNTVNNTDGSTTTSTTNEYSFDGLNGRLDKIIKNQDDSYDLLDGFFGKPEDYDSRDAVGEIDKIQTDAINDLVNDLNNFDDPFSNSVSNQASDWLPSLPNSNCTGAINTTIFGRTFNLDPCVKLQPLRDILAWVFSILAILSIIRIVYSASLYEA